MSVAQVINEWDKQITSLHVVNSKLGGVFSHGRHGRHLRYRMGRQQSSGKWVHTSLKGFLIKKIAKCECKKAFMKIKLHTFCWRAAKGNGSSQIASENSITKAEWLEQRQNHILRWIAANPTAPGCFRLHPPFSGGHLLYSTSTALKPMHWQSPAFSCSEIQIPRVTLIHPICIT